MRRLQLSLAVTVVVTSLLAAQLRVGTYGRPSLLDATTTTTATAATATTTRSSDSSGGRVEAAAVASTIYWFLVHVALVLSSLALTVLQCYRRAMERRGGAAGGPPGSRWNGSRWIVDEVLMPTGGFGGAGLAPATAAGGGLGGGGPPGVRHPPSAYPPGPSAYRVRGASGGGVDDFGTGAGTGTGTGVRQGYQGTESPEEARLQFERERMEAEYWARVEREDEEREAREERERELKAAAKSAKKQAKRQGEGKRRGRKEAEPRARVSFSLNHLFFTRACIFLFTLFSPNDTAHLDRATG